MHARTLADLKLNPSVCEVCRFNSAKNKSLPPCEEDGEMICGFTGKHVKDPDTPMEIDSELKRVVNMWEDIVSISRMETVSETRKAGTGKQIITKHLPTLEKIDFYFNIYDWENVLITRQDCFYLIMLFHREYTGVLRNA